MATQPSLLHYRDRPAALLLWGGLVALALHEWGTGWWGVVALVAGGLLLSALQRSTGALLWMLWTLACWGYIYARESREQLPQQGTTLYDTSLHFISPEGKSHNGNVRYDVMVYGAHEIRLLLHIPPHLHPDTPIAPGSIATGSIDLAPRPSLRSKGYQGTAYLQAPLTELKRAPQLSLRSHFEQLRQKWSTLLSPAALSPKSRSLLLALTLGDRSDLSPEVQQEFAAAGVAHVLAVSGFHLGVVYALVAGLLSWLLPYYRQRQVRYLLLLATLIAYTLLTGAAPSTQRALLMSSLYLGAKLLQRPPDGVQVLALTLLLLFLHNPHSLLSVGLVLSASAVWGIIVLYPHFVRWVSPRQPLLRYLYGLIAVSIAAQVGVLPWLFYYFGEGGIVFLWSTVPISLLALLLIPLGMGALLLALVGVRLAPLYALLDELGRWMQGIVSTIGEVVPLTLQLRFDLVAVLLYYLLVHFCVWAMIERATAKRL